MTPSELVIWDAVRRGRLGHRFRRQEPIGPYIVDFVCFDRMLVIEADGSQHEHSDHDMMRDAYLRQLGFCVLRFENKDIARYHQWVIDEIREALG
jgi:very-short-patch-repair endonuclease